MWWVASCGALAMLCDMPGTQCQVGCDLELAGAHSLLAAAPANQPLVFPWRGESDAGVCFEPLSCPVSRSTASVLWYVRTTVLTSLILYNSGR